jgi:hypothetical protein
VYFNGGFPAAVVAVVAMVAVVAAVVVVVVPAIVIPLTYRGLLL